MEKNNWALIPLFIIDIPLVIYSRLTRSNTTNAKCSQIDKKLKLSKNQDNMLIIDIDNKIYSYSIANVNKFSYIKKCGFVIMIELFDVNKIKLINSCLEPSTLVEQINDHLNNLKVNISLTTC